MSTTSTQSWASKARGGTTRPQASASTGPSIPQSQPFSSSPSTASNTPPSQYQRSPKHQPRFAHSTPNEPLYVLTLLTSSSLHTHMTRLRRAWFPPALLKVDAHVTLFHALPGSHLSTIRRDIRRAVSARQPWAMRVEPGAVFRMGKGVGVGVDRHADAVAREVREELRAVWNGEMAESGGEGAQEEGWLSEQDARRGWKGHYTVMNKVDDKERVERCYEELTGTWAGVKGEVQGLRLWKYDRGWWRMEEDFLFGKSVGNAEQ